MEMDNGADKEGKRLRDEKNLWIIKGIHAIWSRGTPR